MENDKVAYKPASIDEVMEMKTKYPRSIERERVIGINRTGNEEGN